MALQRLDKIIASMGKYSRKEVKQLVKSGKISVNGKFPSASDEKADPEKDEIIVCGLPLLYRTNTYIMLNKPAGFVSATEDNKDKTVLDLLPAEYRKLELFPVGRLDKDTEGLLLLTDDGPLAHDLLSPKKHVDKIYFVRVEGKLGDADVSAFSNGITLSDGTECMPGKLKILSSDNFSEALVTIHEGKFHQIKRMFTACGKIVTYLKRISMGPLDLDQTLSTGEFRELTADEIQALKNR